MSQYGPEGFIADLPDLVNGRWDHACAGFHDDEDQFVLLVAGGRTLSAQPTDSTEILKVGLSSNWTAVPPLPHGLVGLKATTVNNLIYLVGEEDRFRFNRDNIGG